MSGMQQAAIAFGTVAAAAATVVQAFLTVRDVLEDDA